MQTKQTSHKNNNTSLLQAIKDSKPDDWGMLLSAFASSYGIGLLALLGLPFMFGASMDGLGLTESQAGFAGTLEFLAVMMASLLVAPFMDRAPRRTLAFIGVTIAVAGNLLCVFQGVLTYNSLLIFRAIAGLGCGLTLAVGNATVSNSEQPEKLTAHMSALFVTLMAITMLVFSWATGVWGYKGMYSALAVFMFCVSPLLFYLPQHSVQADVFDEYSRPGKSLFSMASFLVLAAMFIFALRDMSGWAFVERIGQDVGYTLGEIGLLLSIQAVLGIFGPLVASVMGSRFGLGKPLAIGIVSSGMVYFVMLLFPTSLVAYTVSAMFIGATYFFTLSYLTALAAELDSQGRIVAASGSFLSAGVAFGPMAGGYLVGKYGYVETSGAIFGMVVLTFACAFYSLYFLKQDGHQA